MTEEHEDRTRVHIYTDRFMIDGEIAMYADARLTDFIVGANCFIAVTDAVVHDLDKKVLFRADFLNLQKEKIVMIMPAVMVQTA
jgi:hypothetical protein